MIGILRALAAKEWLRHGNLVVLYLTAWIVAGWVVPAIDHPGWVLALAGWYALVAGHRFGASEAEDGSEEFALALPPTRGQRYLARLLVGGSPLAVLSGLGTFAVRHDLPPRLWALLVDSGFAEPFAARGEGLVEGLALVLPAAVFGVSFAFAAGASPARAASAWAVGGLAGGGLLAATLALEFRLLGTAGGSLSIPALAVLASGAPVAGWVAYRRRELPARPAPVESADRWWVGALVGFLALLVLLSLLR